MKSVINIGRHVCCDFCNEDFTHSDASGGLIFESKAVCPTCAPRIERDAAGFGETHCIRARCPEGVSFKDFVLEYCKSR